MKAIIKYFLNTFGLMFIVIGLTCNLSNVWQSVFCMIGTFMYIFEKQISVEDEAKQEKQIKKLEEKVEELKSELHKEESKTHVNLEDVPMNYDEYLDRVSDKFNGKTL